MLDTTEVYCEECSTEMLDRKRLDLSEFQLSAKAFINALNSVLVIVGSLRLIDPSDVQILSLLDGKQNGLSGQ